MPNFSRLIWKLNLITAILRQAHNYLIESHILHAGPAYNDQQIITQSAYIINQLYIKLCCYYFLQI